MSQLQVISHEEIVKPDNVDTENYPEMPRSLAVRSFGLTHPGRVRPVNEDQFLIAVLVKALQVVQTSLPQPQVQHSSDRSYLFVVADGMGGHRGGVKASALAIDSVETFMLNTFKWFSEFKGKEGDTVLAEFHAALAHANARVLAEAAEHPELHNMGTTLTLAYCLNDELFVAHVGDSRCYLFRNKVLHRLTSDHTLVEDLMRLGALNNEQAAQHRWRHVVTNAVGCGTPDIKVEVHKVHLESGDAVLLCSDGLTSMVGEEAIARVLAAESGKPERACRRLLDRANEEGGKDNITVVIANFAEEEDDWQPRKPQSEGGQGVARAGQKARR
jgi:protein phosphatase